MVPSQCKNSSKNLFVSRSPNAHWKCSPIFISGNDPSDIKRICDPPKEVDESVWQYEHIRQFILELNLLVVQLQGICTSQSCPKMKATDEWLYLCASHRVPKEVCDLPLPEHYVMRAPCSARRSTT